MMRIRAVRWAVAMVALGALVSPAQAEENRYNVHLQMGVLVNLERPFNPANPEVELARPGLNLRLSFEFAPSEWAGFEVGWAPDVTFREFGGATDLQQRLVAGARFRPWWNRRGGYVTQRPAETKLTVSDFFSDVWLDAHAAAVVGAETRLGYDVGVGTRVPVAAPLQVGVYLRFSQLFAVDDSWDSPTFKQLMAGVEVSLGFSPVHPEPDEDGDGVPDSRDKCPRTPRNVYVNQYGCERRSITTAPPPCSDSDLDGVCDGSDQCADTPLGTRVDAEGCPIAPAEAPEEQPPTDGAPPAESNPQ